MRLFLLLLLLGCFLCPFRTGGRRHQLGRHGTTTATTTTTTTAGMVLLVAAQIQRTLERTVTLFTLIPGVLLLHVHAHRLLRR